MKSSGPVAEGATGSAALDHVSTPAQSLNPGERTASDITQVAGRDNYLIVGDYVVQHAAAPANSLVPFDHVSAVAALREQHIALRLATLEKGTDISRKFVAMACVRLGLVKYDRRDGKKVEKEVEALGREQQHNMTAVLEPIALEQLWANKDARRVLVQGRAGVGKSTLLKLMCQLWAKGELWAGMFDAVVRVSLPELRDEIARTTTWVDVVRHVLPPNVDTVAFVQWAAQNRVLWLLDGADEVASLRDEKKGTFLNRVLNCVDPALAGPRTHVLVSTRPEAKDGIERDHCVEVTGFTAMDAIRYVLRFFGASLDVKSSSQLNFLKAADRKSLLLDIGGGECSDECAIVLRLLANTQLREMACTPLMAELLCYAGEGLTGDSARVTDVYMVALDMMIRRTANKPEFGMRLSPADVDCVLRVLALVAWNSMNANAGFVTRDAVRGVVRHLNAVDRQSFQVPDDFALACGPWKLVTGERYYWMHATFQEYLAAVHMCVEGRPVDRIDRRDSLFVAFLCGVAGSERFRNVDLLARVICAIPHWGERSFVHIMVEDASGTIENMYNEDEADDVVFLVAQLGRFELAKRFQYKHHANEAAVLHGACAGGHEAMVLELLSGRDAVYVNGTFLPDLVNMYTPNLDLYTPLETAAIYGQLAVVKILLDHHARIGRSTLEVAAYGGNAECIALLLDRSVEMAAVDQRGETALHLAAGLGKTKCVALLLDRGADITAVDNYGNTALLHAASKGKAKCVVLLLDRGADIAIINKQGKTALHEAIEWCYRKLECVSVLLDRGPGLSDVNKDGWTPLHRAAWSGSTACVALMLNRGADIAAVDNDGRTALHLTAHGGGDPDKVTLLLERGASVTAVDKDGKTPLHWAARRGGIAHIGLLLNGCADIAAVDNDGQTALHWAARKGFSKFMLMFDDFDWDRQTTECVKLLLDRGANSVSVDKDGQTALHWAALQGKSQCVTLLLDRGADIAATDKSGRAALHWAASEGVTKWMESETGWLKHKVAFYRAARKVESVSLLLDRGAKIDAVDEDGQTALHCAARKGCTMRRPNDTAVEWDSQAFKCVKLLLDRGADIAVVDNDGQTVLHCAAREGTIDIVTLLLDRGANCATVDKDHRTALHYAAWEDNVDCVALLLDRGAAIAAVDKYGQTALHGAAWEDNAECVKLLLDRGADVAAVDEDGRTALHRAARDGATSCVALLLDRGADITAPDEEGHTTLYWAAWHGYANCVALLLDRGADIAAVCKHSQSVLHCAAWHGHASCVALLLDRGAKIDAVDKGGQTALHYAAWKDNAECVKVLLDRGADVVAMDMLEYEMKRQSMKCIELLRSCEAMQ